jgi:glyoxylase-like metal-dependent hydrolase (beta-lactamase superfamily II)
MNQLTIPVTAPVRLAPETFLITNMAPTGPDQFLPVNSMLIRGNEPVIVDTGAPIHRQLWLDQVFNLVDPMDVRWVFLSHDDGDHTGALHDVLDLCPNATLVANFFITERLGLERPLRCRMMREPPSTSGRRPPTQARAPPIFGNDQGVVDGHTVMWAVGSFAAMAPGPVHHVEDASGDATACVAEQPRRRAQ